MKSKTTKLVKVSMKERNKQNELIDSILLTDDFLIIQDLDGVCIPLVKDPLKRTIDAEYVKSASKLKDKFAVLTCGEHEGRRGVNRIIENSLKSSFDPSKHGLYLPGLASCGVELQDTYGNTTHPGLEEKEIEFLSRVPKKMAILLRKELRRMLPELSEEQIENFIYIAVCDTRFTPTINLNEIFSYYKDDLALTKKLQLMMERLMNDLLKEAEENNLSKSFYLHLMPNAGTKGGKEIMKYANKVDIGTTDIQFIIKGAIKQAGLLVLLNKHIFMKTGNSPFGEDFNVRNAPQTIKGLIDLCKEKIPKEKMPVLIGVGDTVTSNKVKSTGNWMRGGSDRNFLTLIQELGKSYEKNNQIIFVNSGNKEVYRPNINHIHMDGVSDPDDNLKFDLIIEKGPDQYVEWFNNLASRYTTKG